jgi:AcrR family transcriptional regulator
VQAQNPVHRGLTREWVVDAALAIADRDGIDAVTLRRLAETLGVTPMALYHHIRDKGHLLDLMASRLLGDLDVSPPDDDTPWHESLSAIGQRFLALVEAHPAAPFLLSRPFDPAAARDVSAALLTILGQAGFASADAVRLLQVLTGMLLGPAIHRATYAAASSVTRRPEEVEASADQTSDWISAADADRLTLDLWVGGVEALAGRRTEANPKPRSRTGDRRRCRCRA